MWNYVFTPLAYNLYNVVWTSFFTIWYPIQPAEKIGIGLQSRGDNSPQAIFQMAARAHSKNTIIIISWTNYHIQATNISSSMFLLSKKSIGQGFITIREK